MTGLLRVNKVWNILHGFLGYILEYWKYKDRLWTRNSDTINSNFFSIYLLELLLYGLDTNSDEPFFVFCY